jgi:hypothetical protein
MARFRGLRAAAARPGGSFPLEARRTMNSVKFKLSMMMFLQFFIWGAWLPLVFGYLPALGFYDLQQ